MQVFGIVLNVNFHCWATNTRMVRHWAVIVYRWVSVTIASLEPILLLFFSLSSRLVSLNKSVCESSSVEHQTWHWVLSFVMSVSPSIKVFLCDFLIVAYLKCFLWMLCMFNVKFVIPYELYYDFVYELSMLWNKFQWETSCNGFKLCVYWCKGSILRVILTL